MISVPYVLTYIGVRTVKFFPPAELVNFNFRRASRMKGTLVLLTAATQVMKGSSFRVKYFNQPLRAERNVAR